jgi:hypothetical protein
MYMISFLASNAVDHGFDHRPGQSKDSRIGMCSTKTAALRSIRAECLARNQNNVSEWSDMSTRRLCQ